MKDGVESLNKRRSIIAIIISLISLAVMLIVQYQTVLKPFELEISIDPIIQIQYKNNLGFYITISFINSSPQSGSLTRSALIINRKDTPNEKYLLRFDSFRVLGDNKITYKNSDEQFPLLIKPRSSINKIINFLYDDKNQFPLSSGVYVGEILFWTTLSGKARYSKSFQIEVTSDLRDVYKERKKSNSTTLEPVTVIGYTELKSRKLTPEEYQMFR